MGIAGITKETNQNKPKQKKNRMRDLL